MVLCIERNIMCNLTDAQKIYYKQWIQQHLLRQYNTDVIALHMEQLKPMFDYIDNYEGEDVVSDLTEKFRLNDITIDTHPQFYYWANMKYIDGRWRYNGNKS